jgi:hypothetical protein
MKLALALLAFSFGFTLSTAALAAPVPLSAIPVASETIAAAHGVMRLADVKMTDVPDGHLGEHTFIAAMDRPVCLGSSNGFAPTGVASFYATDKADHSRLVVERLITGAGDPVLDRTLVDPESSPSKAIVLGHDRVHLAVVADAGAIVAYAYRTTKNVHVIVPRGFASERDAFDPRMGTRWACGFLQMDLDPALGGSVADSVSAPHAMREKVRWLTDLSELLDLETKEHREPEASPPNGFFAVNASLSKVSRDPEPILSITVRAPPSS